MPAFSEFFFLLTSGSYFSAGTKTIARLILLCVAPPLSLFLSVNLCLFYSVFLLCFFFFSSGSSSGFWVLFFSPPVAVYFFSVLPPLSPPLVLGFLLPFIEKLAPQPVLPLQDCYSNYERDHGQETWSTICCRFPVESASSAQT